MKYFSRLGAVTLLTTALSVASFSTVQATKFSPPDRGAPSQAADGGTRGCAATAPGQKNLKALTPGKALPLTLSSHPTFFWYMPETQAQTVQFVLNDQSENTLYSVTLDAPEQAGIMSLSLPDRPEYALQGGKTYHWYVLISCNPADPTGDIFVDGWVERLAADDPIAAQLNGQNNDPESYAEAGVWHEAIAGFAQKRKNAPNDVEVAEDWQEFLESVELGQFAQEPFLY